MSDNKIFSMVSEYEPVTPKMRSLYELEKRFFNISYVETASNLYHDVCDRVKLAAKKGDDRRSQITNVEELKEHQKFVRDAFLKSLNGLPETDAPLNAKVFSEKKHDHFIVEKLMFESRPQVYVTCNLYKPLNLTEPAPAVLVTMGHYDASKAFTEYQYLAQCLVYAGFVVLMMDPIGQGERFDHYETEIDIEPMSGCSAEHDIMDWKCKLLGLSVSRYFVHDCVRALDYLETREDVDSSRIAVTGNSGGGMQTSMLIAAAADRLAAAAPCSYTTDEVAMALGGNDQDNEMTWPDILKDGIDYVDIVAPLAPKPLLFLTNRYDFFPREGTDRTLEKARRLWELAGSPNMPEIARNNTMHSYAPSLSRAITDFLSRHLLGKEADLSGFICKQIPAKELWCTPQGVLIKEYPHLRTLQMELEEEYDKLLKERRERPWEDTKKDIFSWLEKTVCADREEVSYNLRVWGEGICAHYLYRGLLWRAQENYWGVGVLLRDMRNGNKPLPTVIACWPNGLRAMEQHSAWIHRQCSQGKQVLIIDVAASGALSPNKISGRDMNIGWSTMFSLNTFLVKLGDNIAAIRTYHVLRAWKVLEELPIKITTEDISYYGENEFARYTKFAALLSGVSVETAGEYQDYGEILCDKYHDQTHTMDWILPGVLQHFNMSDIDKCLREEGLLK